MVVDSILLFLYLLGYYMSASAEVDTKNLIQDHLLKEEEPESYEYLKLNRSMYFTQESIFNQVLEEYDTIESVGEGQLFLSSTGFSHVAVLTFNMKDKNNNCIFIKQDIDHKKQAFEFDDEIVYSSNLYKNKLFKFNGPDSELFMEFDFEFYSFCKISNYYAALLTNDDDGNVYFSYVNIKNKKVEKHSKILSLPEKHKFLNLQYFNNNYYYLNVNYTERMENNSSFYKNDYISNIYKLDIENGKTKIIYSINENVINYFITPNNFLLLAQRGKMSRIDLSTKNQEVLSNLTFFGFLPVYDKLIAYVTDEINYKGIIMLY